MYTVWPEQYRQHVVMQHYNNWHLKFSQWCSWEFKSCRLLTLCLCMGGSQHSEGEKNFQHNRNCLHSGMASHPTTLKFSICHLLWAHWDTFPQKWYQFAQGGSTIAQYSNNNVRVLEHCTRMWPPAISVIYCQHHEWVYKQFLYIMLKYGFSQTGKMTTFYQENNIFIHIKEKRREQKIFDILRVV